MQAIAFLHACPFLPRTPTTKSAFVRGQGHALAARRISTVRQRFFRVSRRQITSTSTNSDGNKNSDHLPIHFGHQSSSIAAMSRSGAPPLQQHRTFSSGAAATAAALLLSAVSCLAFRPHARAETSTNSSSPIAVRMIHRRSRDSSAIASSSPSVALNSAALAPLPMRIPVCLSSHAHGAQTSRRYYALAIPWQQPQSLGRAVAAILRVFPKKADSTLHVILKCTLLAGIAALIAIIITISVFWIIQDSLVYKPTSVWRGNPKASDMPYYDNVSYCTLDNVEINGWFIKQPPETYRTARTLIYFHGTDKNASFRLKKVVGFYKMCKCNILLLSYRGYGVSTGKPNEKGVRIDAESALDYLKSRGDIDICPGGNLWVFGESLGGAVAVHFASKFESYIKALILENTFTSLLDMIKLEFPILGVFRYLSRNRWQSKKRIGKLAIPILFLSGKQDSYIPPVMMRQMYELAASSPVREFVEFDEGTHNRTWTVDGFYQSIANFMDRIDSLAPSSSLTENKFANSSFGEDNDVLRAAA